jgi:hypothetical protein
MKLPVMVFAAALAVAGSASAQTATDHSGPAISPPEGIATWYYPPEGRVLARQTAVRQARSEMRLVCAADRQKLCTRKAFAHRIDACLAYYRLKVSATCRRAQDHVEVAWRDG